MEEINSFMIPPWEAENFIENLKITTLEDVGTVSWFEYHKKMILLSQQSILEVSTYREETIKELFITFQKIPVLIFEAIQISVWKQKVFPLLVDLNGEPNNTFLLYSVFYQEEVVTTILESILFHMESITSMDDAVIDLIDYAVDNMTALLYAKSSDPSEPLVESISCLKELKERKSQIELDIQIKCVSILRYLAEFIEELPLSAVSRMLCTHDIPYFFAQLIEMKPWKKIVNDKTLIYDDEKWHEVKPNEENKVVKIEAQIWIGLREFLLSSKCVPYYEITRFRRSQFLKLQKYLHEQLLDQIAPLIDLRTWLSYLNVSPQGSNNHRPVTVEIVPEMKISILEKYNKRWKRLAKHQSKYLFPKNLDDITKKAQILSDAYDVNKLDYVSAKKCRYCDELAKKRCSKCKAVWYCKRECQVKDWTNHKIFCSQLNVNYTEEKIKN